MESDKFRWFRSDSIASIISTLSKSTLIDNFPVIMGYGTSMGAYAAVFSEPLRMDRCLLLSPISSLNSALVPWEKRYKEGAKKNWVGETSDGARTSHARKYIVYDPLVYEDRRHAERFSFNRPEVLTLGAPGFGHSTAAHLNSLGGLGSLFQDILNDKHCPKKFFNLMRGRKKLDKYYVNIISKLLVRKNTKSRSLIIVFSAYFKNVFENSTSSMQALEVVSRFFKSLKLETELEYLYDFGRRVYPNNLFFKSMEGGIEIDAESNYESLFYESVRLRREGCFMESIKVSLKCFELSNKSSKPLRQIADI